MITADAGILKLKHKVIEEVARLAWNDGLDEEGKEKLVYEISPGISLVFLLLIEDYDV